MPSSCEGCRSRSTIAWWRSANDAAPGPAPEPGRDPLSLSSAAPQNYMDWAAQQQVFESIAAIAGSAFTLREPGAEPEDLRVQRVTAGFFDVLRVQPVYGRAFTRENEVEGRDRIVVLSDGLWRRRFGADPNIVGRTIPLEGGAYEVVGVMPPDFQYPVGSLRPTDLWVPYVVPPDERIRNKGSFSMYLQTIARLKPGVSVSQAQAQMDQIAVAIQQANPEWNKDKLVGVRPLIDHLVGASTKSWMLMLLGAVAIVLVIACANVANLLLARASAREREVGIRAALGAGRWRLIRQLMVESLVLSTAGTIIATVLAWWAVQVLRTAMPEGVPRVTAIAVDLRVLAATAGLAILTGLLFGIFPALQLSRAGSHARAQGRGPWREHRRSPSAHAQCSRCRSKSRSPSSCSSALPCSSAASSVSCESSLDSPRRTFSRCRSVRALRRAGFRNQSTCLRRSPRSST